MILCKQKVTRRGRPLKQSLSFGFSLLELMVVIVLFAGLVAIAVTSVRALSGFDIKSEITKIAGLTSEVYDRAAMSGTTHRIIFDLDNRSYWAEEKVEDVGEVNPELAYEDLLKSRLKKNDEHDQDEYFAEYKAVEGPLGEKIELPKDLVFYGAWVEQMPEVMRTGQVAIRFFSGGYTQSSFISLAVKGDEEATAMYLSLSPLTGSVKTGLGEPNTQDLRVVEGDGQQP